MSAEYSLAMDSELQTFRSSMPPPPPYSGHAPAPAARASAVDASRADFDLTPLPQSQNRPRLPEERRNPYLVSEEISIVKFQTIVREHREIVVGRIKVPTPGGSHAFILRRYDTDAISLTTMYKVAFPGATDDEERREMEWVRSSFDTRGMNGGRDCDAVRLAGQWVSRHLAIYVAPAYNLMELITALARAHPDPNVVYRKSQRSQIASDEIAKTGKPVPSLAAPSAAEPAAKRARNLSPAKTEPANTDRHITVEATTTITGPSGANVDMDEQITQAKQLVVDLRRQLELAHASGRALEDTGVDMPADTRGRKRGQTDEDEGIAISGGTGAGAKSERVIRKNKKVEAAAGPGGDAGKKIAWGAVMFGLGIGAAAFIPQLASQFPAFASQFF